MRSFFVFFKNLGALHSGAGISIGLLLVAEAGLALGPLGRFQNEMEKELRPGAGEGSCYRYEKKPDSYRASVVAEAGLEHATSRL